MITISDLSLNFSGEPLFKDVNLKFTQGNCYGVIGANGAGKSTFLRILSGDLDPSTGTVSIAPKTRMSVLKQDHFAFNEETVLNTVLGGNERLLEVMHEKDALYMKDTFTEEDGNRAAELESEFAEMGGWDAETEASQLLNGLGLDADAILCHESLAGIIAGRLREHFNKPSFVLTRGETMAKGSGRSIEQYHMYQGLCGVADLLAKFGGHPMAAGLSLEEKNIDEFRRQLNAKANLSAEDFVPRIWIDVPMPFEYVNEKIVQELKELEPFGQGNEKPLFAQKGLMIRNSRVLGKNRNVVKMNLVTDTGHPVDGLLFTDGDRFLEEQAGRNLIDMIYYPDVNEYNGTRTLQAVIKNYKFH